MTIEELELNVIRALGLTLEAISGYADYSDRPLAEVVEHSRVLLKHSRKLADQIEHIAQYSLERIDPAARRRYLSEDIGALRLFLAQYRDVIRARFPWTLPDEAALSRLHDEAGPDHEGQSPDEQMVARAAWLNATPVAAPQPVEGQGKRVNSVGATEGPSRVRRILLSPVVTLLGFLSLPFAAFFGLHGEMVPAAIRAHDKARERAYAPSARAVAAPARARELELFSGGVKPLALVTEWDEATGFERLVAEGRAHVRVLTLPMPRRRPGLAGSLLGLTEDSTTELRFYARPSETWRLNAIADLHAQSSDTALTARERIAIGSFLTATQTFEDFQASLTAPDAELALTGAQGKP